MCIRDRYYIPTIAMRPMIITFCGRVHYLCNVYVPVLDVLTVYGFAAFSVWIGSWLSDIAVAKIVMQKFFAEYFCVITHVTDGTVNLESAVFFRLLPLKQGGLPKGLVLIKCKYRLMGSYCLVSFLTPLAMRLTEHSILLLHPFFFATFCSIFSACFY